MMDWTDRHCRAFHRTLTRRARLYTEMVTADAVIHGPRERLLTFDRRSIPSRCSLAGPSQPSWPKPRGSARISATTKST
jgi:tRNA-dihydrouridine synthase A